jgi:uncharacterized protein YndB with AHSA1/START domain
MIEVEGQINAVARHVGTRTFDAGEARTVTISQTYDAAIEDVWDACTNAGRIPRWFMPVSGDLRPGGRYQLEGNASGEVLTCDPPDGFTATWEYRDEVSWIELRLTPTAGGGTRLELEHIAHVDDVRWTEFGPGAVGVGWDLSLLGLAMHLSSGRPVDREAVAAWMASDDGGRAFMSLSSRRWAEASVGAGADEADAGEAAQRTTAFYCG